MPKIFFRFILIIVCLLMSKSVIADDVILMLGDGMGFNHLKCAFPNGSFMENFPVSGSVSSSCLDERTTESAATATAYACGIKTNLYFIGLNPDGSPCETIAEKAEKKGLSIGIYSTDREMQATPSAFYLHFNRRKGLSEFEKAKKSFNGKMDIVVPVQKLSDEVLPKLAYLKKQKKAFFAFFEEDNIDKLSHEKKWDKVEYYLNDFNLAVKKAYSFVQKNPATTLIVLSDHETGAIDDNCKFNSDWHTNVDVPLFAFGKHAKLFEGRIENTDVFHKMMQILNLK